MSLKPLISGMYQSSAGGGVSPDDALLKTNNLSDLDDTATARENIGLGTTAEVTFGSLTVPGDVSFAGDNATISDAGLAYFTNVAIFGGVQTTILFSEETGQTSGAGMIFGRSIFSDNANNFFIYDVDTGMTPFFIAQDTDNLLVHSPNPAVDTGQPLQIYGATSLDSGNILTDGAGNLTVVSLTVAGITPVVDGTYTIGLGVTNNGTITVASGIITAIQEAS